MSPDYASPPKDGEIVLFCQHADVDDEHIDISIEACKDQPFHWYFVGPNKAKRQGTNQWFELRWVAICNRCHTNRKMDHFETMLARDAPWIGEPPNIERVVQ